MSDTTTIVGIRRTIAMIALLMGAAMDLLDSTLVNMALPTIHHDLQASGTQLQWIVAGYTFAFASVLLTSGRLGDRFGYRRVFIIGCTVFGLASLACALASDASGLVVMRIVQGASAGLMMPQITSMLQAMYRPEERSKVLGLLGAVGGIGGALGPIIGALILSLHLTEEAWRPIFLLNVPLAIVAVVAAVLLVPKVPTVRGIRIGIGAALLSMLGFGLLIYGLISGSSEGWGVRSVFAVVASLVVLGVLVITQRRQPAAGQLVPQRLLHKRSFVAGISLSIIVELILGALLLVTTLTLQTGLGLSPLGAGLLSLPMTAGMVVGVAVLAEWFLPRIGRYVIALGGLGMALGLAISVIIIGTQGAHTNVWELIPGLIVTGLGLGLVMGPLFAITLADVGTGDAGAASGALETAEQFGATLGVATIGSLFVSNLAHGVGQAYAVAGVLAIIAALALICLTWALPAHTRAEAPES